MLRSHSKVGDVLFEPQQNVRPKKRFLETGKIVFLLVAPGLLLIALTVKGWSDVALIRATATRIDIATKQTHEVASFVGALQVERGRSAMMLSGNHSFHLGKHLQMKRQKTNDQFDLVPSWTNINVESLRATMEQWQKSLNTLQTRREMVAEYIATVRQMFDRGELDLKSTLEAYTILIVDLINSGKKGLTDLGESKQSVHLQALGTFMMAVDQVGLIRALGSSMWVSCDTSSRFWLVQKEAIWYSLMEIVYQQSPLIRKAFNENKDLKAQDGLAAEMNDGVSQNEI